MKVVAAIIRKPESVGMLRITQHTVEVDHRVEVPRIANPLIYRLPVGFAQSAGMVVG